MDSEMLSCCLLACSLAGCLPTCLPACIFLSLVLLTLLHCCLPCHRASSALFNNTRAKLRQQIDDYLSSSEHIAAHVAGNSGGKSGISSSSSSSSSKMISDAAFGKPLHSTQALLAELDDFLAKEREKIMTHDLFLEYL
jgi:hypothetical protein